jgi:hypothetical protein
LIGPRGGHLPVLPQRSGSLRRIRGYAAG